MNGARHRQDQLRFRQNVHLRADSQFGSGMDLEPAAQFLELILPAADQIQPLHIVRQQVGTDLADRAGGPHHGGGCTPERNIHQAGCLPNGLHGHGHRVRIAGRHRHIQRLRDGNARIPHNRGKSAQSQDLRAEFFGRFPLSARGNLTLIREMLPAMLLMQLFYPGSVQPPAQLSLREDGVLRIVGHPNSIDVKALGPLLVALRGLGLWTLPMLIQRPVTGHAIHYAGTLPMRRTPGRYECHPNGRLSGTSRIYIADSASFSSLPAKNMSFGMMANAMRIAAEAAREQSNRCQQF